MVPDNPPPSKSVVTVPSTGLDGDISSWPDVEPNGSFVTIDEQRPPESIRAGLNLRPGAGQRPVGRVSLKEMAYLIRPRCSVVRRKVFRAAPPHRVCRRLIRGCSGRRRTRREEGAWARSNGSTAALLAQCWKWPSAGRVACAQFS